MPNLASHSCVAFASMASNTGSSSPGELEMTCSTSEVAVCCSSASESSRVRACTSSNSRTFSIAITAWSAKVVTSSICLSVNGRTVLRCNDEDADRRPFPQQRHTEQGTKAAKSRPLNSVYSGSARTSGCERSAFHEQRPTAVRRRLTSGVRARQDASYSRRVPEDRHIAIDGAFGRAKMQPYRPRTGARPNSTSVLSTVCRSKVERLITLSTSAVAVCCCSRFAQLVEQTGVLDGDDGLTRKVGDQLDLLVVEWPHLLAIDRDRTEQRTLLEHRYGEGRARAAEVGESH